MTWADVSSGADESPWEANSGAGSSEDPAAVRDGAEAENTPPLAFEAAVASFLSEPVSLVDEGGLSAMGEEASALGYVWVELGPPGPEFRGRLGLYVEAAVEEKLEQLGALPPGIHASTGLDASLSDQLYRARLVERRGIALGIPNLEGITNLGRTLDAEDGAVLRWWIAASLERAVRLVLSRSNSTLRVYPSPLPFESLLELAAPVSPLPPNVAQAESREAMDLSDLPPSVAESPVPALAEAAAAEAEESVATESAQVPPAAPEHTTDVLGTQVALWSGVDLPGLDAALGLLPALEEVSEDEPASEAEATRQPLEAAPPLETAQSLETAQPIEEPAEQAAPVASALAHRSVFLTSASRADSSSFDEDVSVETTAEAAADAGDLNAEEFLRVLEEDSQKAPPVEAALPVEAVAPASSQPAALQSEAPAALPPPTLPTKKLRRPFLQMADYEAEPSESASAGAESASAPSSAPSSPEEALPEEALPQEALPEEPLEESAEPQGAAQDPSDPFNQLAQKEWTAWRDALALASGPRPLAVIERMFVTDYTRLREAVRRGIADSSALPVLDTWQSSFQKSYSATFDALRVRGKRPTMVLDLPEIAHRLGRLQGARRVQLLLVDGMRFDLGLMIQERMRSLVDAALTERLLLWSALPSTTTVQLELLGKGPDGLKERFSEEEPPALVARGRMARSPRRIKTGHVELSKIDVIEDALRQPGLPIASRLEAIATETAQAVAEFVAQQSPRTLVVVFGDHGFKLEASGTIEEVRQGGSSPEEVLVPAFAWLTGAVH